MMAGVANGRSSMPVAISRYAASVKCSPSQDTYLDESAHSTASGSEQCTVKLALCSPAPPQHASRAAPPAPAALFRREREAMMPAIDLAVVFDVDDGDSPAAVRAAELGKLRPQQGVVELGERV
jgi:hypothetical protein